MNDGYKIRHRLYTSFSIWNARKPRGFTMAGKAQGEEKQLEMDADKINILRVKRNILEEKITNPDDICSRLYARHVISRITKEEIESIQTPTRKTGKILDVLVTKGNYAFYKFYEILMQAEYFEAAAHLKPFVVGKPKECPPGDGSNQGITTSINDEDLWTKEIQVIHCDRSSSVYTEYWNNDKAYSMNKQKRGRAIIINNWRFYQARRENVPLEDREGTYVDRDRLKLLFEQLFFEVIVFNDATGQNIKDMLEEEKKHPDHKSADCFILIILSHGSKDGIYGVDGTVVPLEIITGYFTARSCPSLAEKPKLFFIQACKGDKTDVEYTACTKPDNFDDHDMFLNRVDAIKGSSTEHLDMCIAYSTYQGFISIGNIVHGTWFIQAVILVFNENSHKEDVLSLLAMVQHKVSECRTLFPGTKSHIRQTANCHSSLTKKLYFFPGCHE